MALLRTRNVSGLGRLFSTIRMRLLVGSLLAIGLPLLGLTYALGAQFWSFYLSQLKTDLASRGHMVADAVGPILAPSTPDNPTALQKVVSDWRDYSDMRLTVVDLAGVIQAATVPEVIGQTVVEELHPGLLAAAQGTPSATVWKSPNFSYQDTMYINVPVRYRGEPVGAVRVAYSLAQIQAKVSRIRNAFFATVAVYALLIVVLTIALSGSFARPVELLNQGARRYARGDLEHEIKVSGTREISELALTLNQMAQRLHKLERLRRQYVSNVSHELRTPLTAIRGMAETILAYGESDPALVTRYIPRVIQQTDRLARLSTQLLDLAQIESGNLVGRFSPVPLRDVLADVQETCLRSAADSGVRLLVEVDDGCVVAGDRDRLEQVFLNLVDNALRYTGEGGTVRVFAADRARDIEVTVQDTGCGIAPEHLPHLFERFYRVDSARTRSLGGTGLGLSIVQQIVLAHQGAIRVESEVGTGTRFTVTLPAWINQPRALGSERASALAAR